MDLLGMLLGAGALIVLGQLALAEHERRMHVLASGRSVQAFVTSSSTTDRGACQIGYTFRLGSKDFKGQAWCSLAMKYSVDDPLTVRFLPEAPEASVAMGDTLWPSQTIVPALLAAALAIASGFSAWAAGSERPWAEVP